VKYILDTNAASALMKGDVRFVNRLEQVPRFEVAIPEPAFAEIAYGIQRLPKSKKRDWLGQRYQLLRSQLTIAPWTETVTDAFGRIKATLEKRGQRIEDFDAAIAAHALAEGIILVTANTSDMARIPGIKLQDWSS
jgi:tRNA(fMet)-specific endonuclease VapC